MSLNARTIACTAGLLGLLGAPPGARARSGSRALRTGTAHLVVVTSTPGLGLEEGMPRDGWYSKGIALDTEGRWDEAYLAYSKAREEFERQRERRPQWAKLIRGWIIKAEFQMDQSRRLHYQPYYRHHIVYVNQYHTIAKHNKWLAIRAFTGHAPRKLGEEIIDEYGKILQQNIYSEGPRILLAALYHELGRHTEARQEFAKVREPDRAWVAKEVAYYFTTAGQVDRALEYLERAIRYRSSDRRYIQQANDFDRLRSEPRFVKLIGQP